MKILITENSSVIQSIYQAVLTQYEDIKFDFAEDASSSRELLAHDHYDLAIFDIELGSDHQSSQDLVAEFQSKNPNSKCYLTLAQDDEEIKSWCQLKSVNFITKSAEFINAVRDACIEGHPFVASIA